MRDRTVPPVTVASLGLALLIAWGVSYYLIGVFGRRIAEDTGWSLAFVSSGFTVSLLTMAAISPVAGGLIDHFGGRRVMAAGSLLTAIGCGLLATAHGVAAYFASWIVLGFAMRLTLYDAAFASLVKVSGRGAKKAIGSVTLFGGLASTVFWPLGDYLANLHGWRGAVFIYALLALCCIPLYWSIPNRTKQEKQRDVRPRGRETPHTDLRMAGLLYASNFALAHAVSSIMSAHLLGLLAGAGLSAAIAVWISTLRGVGQVIGRIVHIALGDIVSPLVANAVASIVIPLSFIIALLCAANAYAAAAFVLLYGAAHGVAAITQGSVPLMLFDTRSYGRHVGRLLVPSFVLSSLSPVLFGYMIETLDLHFVLAAIFGLTIASALCAIGLQQLHQRRNHGS